MVSRFGFSAGLRQVFGHVAGVVFSDTNFNGTFDSGEGLAGIEVLTDHANLPRQSVTSDGFSSADNLSYLRRAGGHYIAGMRMRDGGDLVEQVLSRQGRYQSVRDNLRVKEVRIDDIRGAADTRFIICHNPEQAERDKTQREQAIARIEAELDRIYAQRERGRAKATNDKAKQKAEAAHVRAECALRDHPTLKRWILQQASGRLVIDRAKVTAEQRLDGKYLLAISDPDITAEDAALGYKNLLEAERGFRDLKSELLLRPVFHRLEHRIRAHVLICWLALLLTRVAELSCCQTWRNIRRETARLQQVTLAGEAGAIIQTTPLRTQPSGHLPGVIRHATTANLRVRSQLNLDKRIPKERRHTPSPDNSTFPQFRPRIWDHM